MIVETKSSIDQGSDEKAWLKILAEYRTPHAGRSVFELTVTAIPFAAFWTLTWLAVHFGFWWGFILIVPAAGFLLRLLMIQHDCGHGSFFARRRFDDWTGRILGVLTLTPYDYWRKAHAVHHASAGNLDARGVGDITTLTVVEYRRRSRWGRIRYRLYRHPLVMFGVGPAFPLPATPSDRDDARRLASLGFSDGHKRCGAPDRCSPDLGSRPGILPRRSSANRRSCRVDWCLAFLCAASI